MPGSRGSVGQLPRNGIIGMREVGSRCLRLKQQNRPSETILTGLGFFLVGLLGLQIAVQIDSVKAAQIQCGGGIRLARPERFELPTLCFEGRCSIQLSYGRTVQPLYHHAVTATSSTAPTSNLRPFGPIGAFSDGSSKPKPIRVVQSWRNSTSSFSLE